MQVMQAERRLSLGIVLRALVLGLVFAAAGLPESLRASALGFDKNGHQHSPGEVTTGPDDEPADFGWAECRSGTDCLAIGISAWPPAQTLPATLRGAAVPFPGRIRPGAWSPLFEPPPPRLPS